MPRTDPDTSAETLGGCIERVTFHNEDTGFSVLKIRARGHRELVAVLATAPDLQPGEWIDAHGHWEVDTRHGPQFRADRIELRRPETAEGIERYLGSGLIHGIGKVYAAKLVGHFGAEVLRVIEHQSRRLEEVAGIGPQRRAAIKAAWEEQKSVREIMTFLFSHGVSTARAYRIYKMYGADAIAKVRMDPYCLARDIPGIGFQTADQVAKKLGIANDSDVRARAGVEHALLELTDDGHCAYPRRALEERAAAALGIPESRLTAAVGFGVCEGRLVERRGPDGEPWIYLAALDFAETELARLLATRLRRTAPLAGADPARALPWVEKKIGLTLDPTQRDALVQALRAPLMVLTGGPGVGKTTLVRAILAVYRAKGFTPVLCAPTGRAAKRLSETAGLPARTIHRLLGFDPGANDFLHNARRRLTGDVFVIDEASMLDLTLAWKLVRAIPDDAVVLFVGDADQLPSVGPGRVLADLIESGVLPVARLRHVFRQAAQSRIITNAHRIHDGEMPEIAEKGVESDFYVVTVDDPARALSRVIHLVRQAVPQKFRLDPFTDIQVLTPMQRGELGARNLNQALQAALNPRGPSVERFGTVFRKGDKVMQVENDYDKDVFNGDIGRIVWIEEEERQVQVKFDDRTVRYEFNELDELAPAYAITIHKSQGSEYPCVIVPFHTQHFVMLQRNLLYTAVTRGRKLVVLVGSPRAIAMAVKRTDSGRRLTTLRERLVAAARGGAGQTDMGM